jgi:hypothetical protein
MDDSRLYEIESVGSDTSLTLRKPFQGATGAAQNYAIIRNWAATMTAELAARVAELVNKYESYIDSELNQIIGPKGDPGWSYKGTWASARSYNALDIAVYNSALYIVLSSHTSASNNAPGTTNAPWFALGLSIQDATESTSGIIRLATAAEAETGTEGTKAMTPATVTILIRNTLRAPVEAASGGKVTVLYDDLGNPSYMRRFAPMMIKELYRHYFANDAAWNASVFKEIETQVHPAFLKNGTVIKELLVGQYLACNMKNRACSLPGMTQWTSITHDTALAGCKNKGAGWTMSTIYIRGFLQALCLRQGYQPRGNTDFGRAHDMPRETGLRIDSGIPGVTGGNGATKSGTGPASWNHDGTESGIADLVGNMAEYQDLMKLSDGKIMMPADNNIDLAEASWPDTGACFDATNGTPDGLNSQEGVPVISDTVSGYSGPPPTASVPLFFWYNRRNKNVQRHSD